MLILPQRHTELLRGRRRRVGMPVACSKLAQSAPVAPTWPIGHRECATWQHSAVKQLRDSFCNGRLLPVCTQGDAGVPAHRGGFDLGSDESNRPVVVWFHAADIGVTQARCQAAFQHCCSCAQTNHHEHARAAGECAVALPAMLRCLSVRQRAGHAVASSSQLT